MSENNETDQSVPHINSAKTKEEEEQDFNQVNTIKGWEADVVNRLRDVTAAVIPHSQYEDKAKQTSYLKHNQKDEQLSLKDYQEVCAYHSVKNIKSKLIALHALGKDEEAEKILPGFKKNFGDKISVNDMCSSIMNEDSKALDDAIIKNFNKIYPDFCKDTENAWQQKHDFQKPEIQMKDNQFINLTRNVRYDVENAENQEYAYKFRKTYTDIVESAKNKEKVQENTRATSKETDNSNTETGIKEKVKTAAIKRKQNTPQVQKTNKPVKEQMKNAAQQHKNQKKICALRQENVAKNDNIPSREQIVPVKNVENNKLRNLAEILKRKLISSRTDR